LPISLPSAANTSEAERMEGFSSSDKDGSLPKTPHEINRRNKTEKPSPIKKILQKYFTAFVIFYTYNE
jgi:hypothetical protein